ncbi:hypothetical protein BDFB_000969, partial [Asbolus verrucosus]
VSELVGNAENAEFVKSTYSNFNPEIRLEMQSKSRFITHLLTELITFLSSVAESVVIVALGHLELASRLVGTLITQFATPAISSETRDFLALFAIEPTGLMHTARWFSAPYVANLFMGLVTLKLI